MPISPRLLSKRRYSGGFTLVEMLVTLSIFAVITVIVLARYRDFSGGIVLTNLAYDVAITIRQAQVYGLSVKSSTSGASFNIRYGIHVSYPTNNSFILFADTDGNGRYSGGGEALETLGTLQGDTIDDFCGVLPSSATECGKSGQLTDLDVMFLRPNPDALFSGRNTGTAYLQTGYQSATITVASPATGRTKVITVRSTGQISVN